MTDTSCLFCKIVEGSIDCQKVHETSSTLAFRDISPQARSHILVIPKLHLPDFFALSLHEGTLAEELIQSIGEVAQKEGLVEKGFRVTTNNGSHAQQSVFHLHFHLLGGQPLGSSMVGL